ncbi:MAG: hypothetical protein JRI55_19795 [Deltaproteobacteria bacterium]|jgi:hypothetical protein|nr:hypothetical protein [Deltaproteobacteria bacterium]
MSDEKILKADAVETKKTDDERPEILAVEETPRDDRPNTCQACTGNKFC